MSTHLTQVEYTREWLASSELHLLVDLDRPTVRTCDDLLQGFSHLVLSHFDSHTEEREQIRAEYVANDLTLPVPVFALARGVGLLHAELHRRLSAGTLEWVVTVKPRNFISYGEPALVRWHGLPEGMSDSDVTEYVNLTLGLAKLGEAALDLRVESTHAMAERAVKSQGVPPVDPLAVTRGLKKVYLTAGEKGNDLSI